MNSDSQRLNIVFDSPKLFEAENIKPLNGLIGLYFIFSNTVRIEYPFGQSRLLYIGMSEKKTNSMGSRLIGHFEGKSGNMGLTNYRKREQLYFTFINFEMVRKFWNFRIENLEAYFLLDFVEKFGVYPICNNKTGFEVLERDLNFTFNIDWSYFN